MDRLITKVSNLTLYPLCYIIHHNLYITSPLYQIYFNVIEFNNPGSAVCTPVSY